MNKKIFKKIAFPLNYVNKLIKKNDRKILLYSNLGFRDNIKSIFDFLIFNGYNEKYEIICSLNDSDKYTNIKIKNVKFTNNFRGIYYYFTSKYCFYCFGKYPIKPSANQIVINLWHGMPLKKIGNMEPNNKNEDYNYFTYVLSTSPFFSQFMMEAFNCNKNQVFISGQPRTDELFLENDVRRLFNIYGYRNIIIWLPTFRYSTKLHLTNQLSEIKTELSFPIIEEKSMMIELNELLVSDKSIMLIKPHPMQDLVQADLDQYTNIRIIQQKDLDEKNITLYNLLKEADALITDYSSVYFDYLLLNRPIGFTVNDIEDYKVSRGFVIENPLEIMPGEKIVDYKTFIGFVKSIIEKKDRFIEERNIINDLCNTYKDGKNSKRIIEFCGITLD